MRVVSVNSSLRTASVCDKYKVVLRECDRRLLAVHFALDRPCDLSAVVCLFEQDIRDLCLVLEGDACRLEVLNHRQDQRLVLVVLREFQRAEIGKTANMMDESLEIEFHLERAVPVLKREHRSPVQPEGGAEHFIVKHILDGLVVQILVPCHEKLHDLHTTLLTQVELAVCVRVHALFHRGAAEGIIRIFLVQPVVFVQNRYTRCLYGRDAPEQIPQTLEMILHLTSAAHHIASRRIVDPVTCAARQIHRLQYMNVSALHLSVPHEEAGCRERSESAAHDVCGFAVDTLGL